MSKLLDAALHYHALGACVLPVGTDKKVALRSWAPYQDEQPDVARLRLWFSRPGLMGLAIVTGAVSGGWVVRDFDDPAAYETWKAAHPELAATLPTVKTGRGYHVHFRGPEGYKVLDDGEYRGDSRHYTILPPSVHETGVEYEWVNGAPKEPPPEVQDPCGAGLLTGTLTKNLTESTESTELTESTENTERTESTDVISTCSSEAPEQRIEHAIQLSLPTGPGQRNKDRLFLFARALKAIPELAQAGAQDLAPYLRRWHERALPFIRTKEFDVTRLDFRRAWRSAILPLGEDPLPELLREADDQGVPPEAAHLDHNAARRLAGFCRLLQQRAGDQPFFLSCRTAGRLLGVSHETANEGLSILLMDGLLVCVALGSAKTMRASRYRHVGEKKIPKNDAA